MKQFAPEYARDEHGWILFPRDDSYRRSMFPAEVNQHPAKANVFMIQSCIEYVSEIDQLILDPFGGTGTLIVGALAGRKISLIEISPLFFELINKAVEYMDKNIAPGLAGNVSVFNLPLQNVLPIPNYADHIISSPPYASLMKSKGTDKFTSEHNLNTGEYTYSHPLNLGGMSDWLWAQEMEKTYKKCFDSLKPGGTFTLIVKDHMKDRKRVALSQAGVDACKRVGFTQDIAEWFKWKAPGSAFTGIYRARGWEVVDEEDVIVLRRPIK
jgi:DNA modification methylase